MATANSQILASEEDIKEYAHVKYVFDEKDWPNMTQIDEEVILKAWFYYKNEPVNSYDAIINRASFFTRNGLTPVYYTDSLGTMVVVTSREHLEKRMH